VSQLIQASSVPIDHFSFESVELLRDIAARWADRRELAIARRLAIDVRFELARILYHQDSPGEAAKILEPALSSNECRVHNLLARIYSARGESASAEAQVRAIQSCKATAEHR
jgi:Tfp pilus assembly protein PilF